MNALEAQELIKQGKAVIIDVREEPELRESGTAEGALWMPLSAMEEDGERWRSFKKNLPKDKQLILYCKLGGRSGRMTEYLCADGFQAVNLGGFFEWKNAGLPVQPFRS